MKVETVKLSEISQDPANARIHSDRNIEAIMASMRAFGQQKPIVVDTRGIILAGNGTYEAARRLGWDSIAIHRTTLEGHQAALFAIADNRTSELAIWDTSALAKTFTALKDLENLPDLTGFSEIEMDRIIIEDARGFNDLDDDDDDNGEVSSMPIEDMMTVSIPLTTEQEIMVKRAISLAKKNGAITQGDAIAVICERYIERHG